MHSAPASADVSSAVASSHDEGHAARHHPFLAHHFETPQQQFDSGKLGMWLFLVTEVLFFSGLFVVYAIYRSNHPEIFIYAHQFLDKTLGAINTGVLIASSLTMAWAVRCAQKSQTKGLIWCLSLTLVFASVFLGIKYVEYKHKWEHGILWGERFNPTEHVAEHGGSHDLTHSPQAHAELSAAEPHARAAESATPKRPENAHIFFGIYFMMTGLHGIHILAGMAVIGWLLYRATLGHFSSEYYGPVDFVGLYWHLVDLIWIYLFPLLYLIH